MAHEDGTQDKQGYPNDLSKLRLDNTSILDEVSMYGNTLCNGKAMKLLNLVTKKNLRFFFVRNKQIMFQTYHLILIDGESVLFFH